MGGGADRPTRIRNQYGKFAQIPEVLVRDPKVSDRAIRIYALLWTYSGEKGRKAWPSRREMSECLEVSVSTIDRGLRELEERGAIAVESDYNGDRQTSNIYTILVLPDEAPKSRKVVHRGRKSDAPRLSTGAANLTTPGAANLTHQEQEPQEQEISGPVPEVTTGTAVDNSDRTGRASSGVTPRALSRTHGLPLQPADVFASCGHQLPDHLDDAGLQQLADEIIAKASSRVLDPTAYVIRALRIRGLNDDLADKGRWLARAEVIADERGLRTLGAGGMF
jgi:hypothetical protein